MMLMLVSFDMVIGRCLHREKSWGGVLKAKI